MIERIARKISNWLVINGEILPEDQQLYEYAAFNLLFTSIPILIFLTICFLIKLFIDGIIIVFVTLLIRRYAGGYHARKPIICVCISSAMLVSSLYISLHLSNIYVQTALMFFSIVWLWIHSPIDSEQKRLDDEEKVYIRYRVKRILILVIVSYVVLLFGQKTQWACCLCMSVLVSALLQIVIEK